MALMGEEERERSEKRESCWMDERLIVAG